MWFFTDDAFDDIIDGFIDNDMCPQGRLIMGCPIHFTGEPAYCDECWHSHLKRYAKRI